MILWMVWTLAISGLLALSAVLLSRAASYVGAARRFVWIVAMLVAGVAPFLLPSRTFLLRPQAVPTHAVVAVTSAQSATQETQRATSLGNNEKPIDWNSIVAGTDRWVALAWALWSCVMLMGLARAVARLRARSALWNEIDSEVGRVSLSTEDGPAVVGWLRARIVIPSWVLDADAPTRALILRHELEHLRARDTRLLLVAELIRTAFPWNAAIGWMASQLRLAIELDCDARVIRASGVAHAYGVMLLTVSERFATELPLAASMRVSRFDLERRLEVLAAKRRRHPIFESLPYAAVALGVLTTAAWTPRPGFPRAVQSVRAGSDSDLVRVGYTQRKQRGAGFFMDGAGIDRTAPHFSDVFRTAPGLRIFPSANGKTNVITSVTANATTGGGCVRTYVDGALWQTTVPGDIDDNVRSADIIAAELYHGANVPRQFSGDEEPPCAALVVWTQAIRKRRR